MFRHLGKSRTLDHNLKIASLLSFIAGVVNVVGFLGIQRLTTNVTGHFAYLMDEILKLNIGSALIYFLYVLFFFLGAFLSSVLTEIVSRKSDQYIYALPASIECIILLIVGLGSHNMVVTNSNIIACCLLFAMGLQNSLVTSISSARVRTTHLTGLFTDLGIELSQLFFYKETLRRKQLVGSIRLRLTIICFFFIGGLIGGLVFSFASLHTLIFAAAVLAGGLLYDTVKFKVLLVKRKMKND